MSFKGKVIAITGGASGMGLATAKLLASRGATLSIADNNEQTLSEARKHLEGAGATCLATVMDVTDSKAVDAWVAATVKQFGKLNGAVNCAGIGNPSQSLIIDCTDEDWKKVQDVNLSGVFYSLRAELRAMADHGSIVNIASLAGLMGFPTQVSYCASKHGVIALTKTAAKEEGHRGIRCNALAPGLIDTPLLRGPSGGGSTGATSSALEAFQAQQALKERIGTAEEVANLIEFLLSPTSSFITGSVYTIDGGISA